LPRPARSVGATLVLLALAAAWAYGGGEWPPRPAPESPLAAAGGDEARIEQAFRERRGDLWVEVPAVVEKRLSDDRDGSRHQRFIVRLANGHTLLVAHNIDLAERVPLSEGDALRLRGEYEWNERGGVLHWTHHDPEGRRPGGFVEHAGRRYR
jgi:hypothetical protein